MGRKLNLCGGRRTRNSQNDFEKEEQNGSHPCQTHCEPCAVTRGEVGPAGRGSDRPMGQNAESETDPHRTTPPPTFAKVIEWGNTSIFHKVLESWTLISNEKEPQSLVCTICKK